MHHTRTSLLFLLFVFAGLPVYLPAQHITLPNGSAIGWIGAKKSSEIHDPLPAPFQGKYIFLALADVNQQAQTVRATESREIDAERIDSGVLIVSTSLYPSSEKLNSWGLRRIAPAAKENKLSANLLRKELPEYARAGSSTWKIRVLTAPGIDLGAAEKTLRQAGFVNTTPGTAPFGIFEFITDQEGIDQLASFSFLQYLEPGKPEPRTLNKIGRAISRAYTLNAPVSDGGRGLNGEGMTVGVGDDADPTLHPDLYDRIINHTPGLPNAHGGHTTGTIAGGGIVQPQFRGYAPMAVVVNDWFNGVWSNAVRYYDTYRMVITNNSYGSVVGECEVAGAYDLDSRILDDLAWQVPAQLHVFASGNDGTMNCEVYPTSYGTVLAGYQSAKNVIVVGRTTETMAIGPSSSSGPTRDGRVKPDIVAYGSGVISTNGNFSINAPYVNMTGTSMASPQVTGGLTLLYQRYRQLHNDADPRGDLMKAILLNGAWQPRGDGPDYRYGFGVMHLENSLRILENNLFAENQVRHSQTQIHTIAVPPSTAKLKLMLYWHDLPSAVLNPQTLINDLDVTITDAGGQLHLPLVLNTDSVTNLPRQREDHLNNAEQMVIANPAAGNYIVQVSGTRVTNTAQPYALVWDFVPLGLKVSNPVAGSKWATGVRMPIVWDYEGNEDDGFKLEFSLDGGNTWSVIAENISPANRFEGWTPPAGIATNRAIIRITEKGTAVTAQSGEFTIIGSPAAALAPLAEQCPGYLKLNWNTVRGATGYRVMLKKGYTMQAVADLPASDSTYTIGGLHTDSAYYAGVVALLDGKTGLWAKAVERKPSDGECRGSISDGDLAIISTANEVNGREFTSTGFSNSMPLKIRVKNLDDQPINHWQLTVQAGGSNTRTVTITSPLLPGRDTLIEVSGFDFSANNVYDIVAVVRNNAGGDSNPLNDTLRYNLRRLANAPLDLSTPFREGFEQMPAITLMQSTYGFGASERWDYVKTNPYDRLRTQASPNSAHTGSKAITMDVTRALPHSRTSNNNLIGTFNLSGYRIEQPIRLDFWFAHHGGLQDNLYNSVWIRGSDQDPWIRVLNYNIFSEAAPGAYHQSPSIELNKWLDSANQQFSSSFQVYWGQKGDYSMSDITRFSGVSIDDIQLYLAQNDIQLLEITGPTAINCGLGTNTPVRLRVRNSMDEAITNIPVKYQVGNGPVITETINRIEAGTEIEYQFSRQADFSQLQEYTLLAWTDLPGDNVRMNDTATLTLHNQPLISAYPYVEDFEEGQGNFFAKGVNASWEFGMPRSLRLAHTASGQHIWKTRLQGNYNDNEYSYLYTPCYDLRSLQNPTISFAMFEDIEDCSSANYVCDALWMEYSTDGENWTKLGEGSVEANWYSSARFDVWMKAKNTYWRVATNALPANQNPVMLRFVFKSDEGSTRDGAGVDDVHIYDNTPMYVNAEPNGATEPVTKSVSGNEWVDFETNGKMLISVHAQGNDLGPLTVRAYDTANVRTDGNQLYAQRSFSIVAENNQTLHEPALVRLYFEEDDVNNMRHSPICPNCEKVVDYTQLNITRYQDTHPNNIDGFLANNLTGYYSTVPNERIRFIPYDRGYYAEFEVYHFSEFYITDGGFMFDPPAEFVTVDGVREAGGNRVSWEIRNELYVRQYTVEVSTDAGRTFRPVHQVDAGNADVAEYEFLDAANYAEIPVILYRIRRDDLSGQTVYSSNIFIQTGNTNFYTRVYPNPFSQEIFLDGVSPQEQQLQWQVFDVNGRLLLSGSMQTATPLFTQRINGGLLRSGYYILKIYGNNGVETHRLIKMN